MDEKELRQNNLDELNKGTTDLVIYNESRLALVRDASNPWMQIQFEMLSNKLDILLDLLINNSVDPEMLLAQYSIDFQLRLSKLLDSLVDVKTDDEAS